MFLPEGCVSAILSLTSPKDAFRASLVSTTFQSAVDADAVWERFLPSDYPEILPRLVTPLKFSSKKELFLQLCNPLLIDGGSKSFKLEKSSGKKCYAVSARELSITWGNDPMHWSWISVAESRCFSTVAVLRATHWLEIRGKIRTKVLTPNTRYGAFLVMEVSSTRAYGLDTMPCEVSIEVGGRVSTVATAFLRNRKDGDKENGVLREREDGWTEMELGEFFSGEDDEEVKMGLREVKGCHLKGGLIIEAIEVRPKH